MKNENHRKIRKIRIILQIGLGMYQIEAHFKCSDCDSSGRITGYSKDVMLDKGKPCPIYSCEGKLKLEYHKIFDEEIEKEINDVQQNTSRLLDKMPRL